MSHQGKDFSSFQGNLTPADVAGIDFAYIKATQGDSYQNPDAVQQAAMCRQHGVRVGFYHFFDPAATTEDQVHNFTRYVSALGGTKLPLALDTEEMGTDTWPALASQMMNFAVAIEGLTLWVPHPRSLLYVNLTYYENLQGFPWGRWVWLADPNPGAPHKPCLVLQGAPRPVSSTDAKSVDPDTFLGSEADWATFTDEPVVLAPCQAPPGAFTAPGYGIPGTPQIIVLGKMVNGSGLYQGYGVLNGATVYTQAGADWVSNFNPRTLATGAPLAILCSNIADIGTMGQEQL